MANGELVFLARTDPFGLSRSPCNRLMIGIKNEPDFPLPVAARQRMSSKELYIFDYIKIFNKISIFGRII